MPTPNASIDFTEIYTNSPKPHPNLILGGLQLLFWLFVRPVAWYEYSQRIKDEIDSWDDLRKPNVLYFLLQGYLIVPILANLIFGFILLAFGQPLQNILSILLSSIATCLALSVAFGVAFGVAGGVRREIENEYFNDLMLVGLVFAAVGGFGFGVAGGIKHGIWLGIAYGFAFSVLFFLGITINVWRPIVLYPLLGLWNLYFYQLEKQRVELHDLLELQNILDEQLNKERTNKRRKINLWKNTLFLLYQVIQKSASEYSSLLFYNSAFWDQWQRLPLYGLDKYLLLVIERNPVEGAAAINYLETSFQKWVVQIGKDALRLRNCTDVESIRKVHQNIETNDELENSTNPILRVFLNTSQNVDAALNQKSSFNQRIALSSIATDLNRQLENFNRSTNKYASSFKPFAQRWLEIIENYINHLTTIVEQNQEIDNPYIIGVPLTLEQEIFTGRDNIGLRIERLLLDRRRPPLLLYGQRRMGKTSLLNNISKLLPNTIIPMFVDLQGTASSASNHTGFLYNLAREMIKSAKYQSAFILPSLTREKLEDDPFTRFNEWLDEVEKILEQNTALLMLDEFETLDNAISKGRFDEEDVLGILRHLIQHRPKFKVLLAGSHTIEEYQRWASYLINVQVVHISYLKEAEARQLIESPIKDFPLIYEPEALTRVLQITRCHPFLVQLLCGEIITLKNEQDPLMRRLARLADVETAIPEALQSGSFFFADIQTNQVDDNGRNILKFMATQGEGSVIRKQIIFQQFSDTENSLSLLLQRDLIAENNEGYCFQVELIRRWFASNKKS